MEYRAAEPRDYQALREFLSKNGWEKRVADAERFCAMMDNADRTVVAVENGRVVGFARALCDGVSNGYIGTVAVAEDHRGLGIGREIVRRIMGDNPNITWVLRSGRGSSEFWRKMGFTESSVAMERTRIL
jgi:N-acetylglutamate synthase-like GNAT family acetyltransferase